MNGKNLFVSINGSVVACATDCELSESLSLKETSTIMSGKAKTYKADTEEWKVTCSHIIAVTNFSRLRAMQKARIPVTLTMTVDFDGAPYVMSGQAFLTRMSSNGAVGRLARTSVEFTGSGNLT